MFNKKRIDNLEKCTTSLFTEILNELSKHNSRLQNLEIGYESENPSIKTIIDTFEWQLQESENKLKKLLNDGEENVVDYDKKINNELQFIQDLKEILNSLEKHNSRWIIK